VPHVYPLFAN